MLVAYDIDAACAACAAAHEHELAAFAADAAAAGMSIETYAAVMPPSARPRGLRMRPHDDV